MPRPTIQNYDCPYHIILTNVKLKAELGKRRTVISAIGGTIRRASGGNRGGPGGAPWPGEQASKPPVTLFLAGYEHDTTRDSPLP